MDDFSQQFQHLKIHAFLQQFQHLKIQLEDITSATDNFNDDNCIGRGGFGKVYKGELSHSKGRSTVAIKRLDRRHGQGIPEFLKEITTLSGYRHENLISLLGFCYQGDEMILVYDYASRGSLDRYLNLPHLTWLQRLKICLDAAQGLRYLHDPRGTHQRIIHCDVKSSNILLDDNWNGKVSDFGLSKMGPANEQQSVIVTMAAGTFGYIDPLYWMTNILTKESDVYSFGIVLFEVLCGRLCCTYSNGRLQQNLVRTWIESYEEKKLNDIIFKDTAIEPLEQSALETFSDIAYRCLKESREDRPRMVEVVTELETALIYQKQFQDLKIPLEEITSATNHFNVENNYIGGGAFGKVYRGEVSHRKGRSMTAIKRIDPKYGQGIPNFLKKIRTLSCYRHENIVSLLGFCYQGDEMILVYEHVSRGSLDRYLDSPHLTWSQRLKICLDAAKGLRYLHDQQRLIHYDVKSANILLDDQWNAKVSDVGLSIMGPANEHSSVTVTVAASTPGYCDPQYAMRHTLTKKSDVYSLGVVLFEVLCGRLCYTLDSKDQVKEILVTTWIKSYEQNKLNDIIFKDLTIQPLEQSALEIFADIAYQCLKESREDRPKMAEVVAELEKSLELVNYQEFIGEWNKQCPLNYRSDVEPMKFQFKGILRNSGKTWFSVNKKGEHCEVISIAECLGSDVPSFRFSSEYNSRFAVGTCRYFSNQTLKADVKTQFLSPGITYTVNLVFKFAYVPKERRCEDISLKYRLQGERESSISYLAYEREDGWWACELFQFTTDHRTLDLQILFEEYYNEDSLRVEGIEFLPLEIVEHVDDSQTISDSDSDSDANWEEKLPTDYADIMKLSKKRLWWRTEREVYSIMFRGFLIRDDKRKRSIWFSLDKTGKKCHMLSAALILRWGPNGQTFSTKQSRLFYISQSDFLYKLLSFGNLLHVQ
uniref:Putative death-associated protein kinase 1 n=1 Tax=Helianthus annuus TaxID=4232 RepID=A0A251SXU1_HELAN